MKLLYTGASKFEQSQTDPVKSLGGLISSTEIQDETLGSIWGSISKYTIWNLSGKSEYCCIAIKNDGGTTLTGFKAFFDPTDDSDSLSDLIAEFEIGYEVPVVDPDCGDLSVSQTTSPYAKPYNIVFVSAELEENALDLPDLEAGDYLTVWVKRTVKSIAKDPLSSDDYLAILNDELVLDVIEQINLKLIWD